jgi:8-oxo-dGTP diphosphatase
VPTYEYPRPALSVDCAVFGLSERGLEVLLIQRDSSPFEGAWALPGGFVRENEGLEDAARRELREETGLAEVFLEQLYTFGAIGRDPRGHVVSVAWVALVNVRDHAVSAATDARDAAFFPIGDLPELAFDHDEILALAEERVRGKVRYRPIGFELLPERFTLAQLQHLYETVLGRELDKRNFRKKLLAQGFLEDTGEREEGVPHRPARLYRFDPEAYARLEREGFEMWI